MIIVSIKPKINVEKKLRQLLKVIGMGMVDGAYNVAEGLKNEAQSILEPYNKTGNLSGAIEAIAVKSGIESYRFAEADVVVDTKKAPYAMWIELGKYAGDSLPYSKSGKKDYSKSKFAGYNYLTNAFNKYSESNVSLPIVANAIAGRILLAKL